MLMNALTNGIHMSLADTNTFIASAAPVGSVDVTLTLIVYSIEGINTGI